MTEQENDLALDQLLKDHSAQIAYRDDDDLADQRMERAVLESLQKRRASTELISGTWGLVAMAASIFLAIASVATLRTWEQAYGLALLADPELVHRLIIAGGL